MAIQVIREVSADVVKRGVTRAVYAKQNDFNSRFLNIRIQEDGKDVVVDSTSQVMLNVERPDKLENMFYGTVNENGTVKVPMTSWMLELAGTLVCDVSIIAEDPNVAKLTTMSFNIYVEEAVISDNSFEETENYSIIIDLLNRTERIEEYVAACDEATQLCVEATEASRPLFAIDPKNDGNIVLQYGGVFEGDSSTPVYVLLKPDFANSIEECVNTNSIYVLPDGYIYAYMAHEEYPFTNQITLSVDTDKTPYNGLGYKIGYRINSEGLEVEAAGARVTGYIPVKEGDVLYFKNIGYKPGLDVSNAYLAFYNESFENVQAVKSSIGFDNVGFVIGDYTTDEATGQLLSITVRDKYSNGVSYFRISSDEFDNTAIITVNEEITGEPVVTYRWTNTGHAFVPADYEDRIIKAENDITTLKQAIAGDIAVYGMVDEENNIVMTGTLTPGKYSLKYMNEDGTTMDIGEFTMW